MGERDNIQIVKNIYNGEEKHSPVSISSNIYIGRIEGAEVGKNVTSIAFRLIDKIMLIIKFQLPIENYNAALI